MAAWDYATELGTLWWSRHGGPVPAGLAASRLQALVGHSREHSPFYRELYAHLPEGDVDIARLPVVSKPELMARFDDWCTDRDVTRARVEPFLADRARIGERFLGRYHVWKSSGTTGTPGIFLQDEFALSVYDALVAAQCEPATLGPDAIVRSMLRSGRAALIAATGDHFAAIASWQRDTLAFPAPERRAIPVTWPLERIVRELQAFDPAFLAAYPSMLRLLAGEQRDGRLRLAPAIVWSGGETLTPRTHAAIESAFGCRVMNEYGASECLSVAYECIAGWMHANSEWALVEAVDARGAPVAPGQTSHTVLVTNLANRVQPVIRYDLGDRLHMAPKACACGDPRPAFRVHGRRDDIVSLRAQDGRLVTLVPLAIETVIEDAGVECRFQVVQSGEDALGVRLDAGPSRPAAWRRAREALHAYLETQGLANVRLALDRCAPRLHPRSGKLPTVLRCLDGNQRAPRGEGYAGKGPPRARRKP